MEKPYDRDSLKRNTHKQTNCRSHVSCTFSQVLGVVVDGILPYDQDSSELLQDALAILSSKVSAQPAPAVCQGYTALLHCHWLHCVTCQGYTAIGYIVSPVRVSLSLAT